MAAVYSNTGTLQTNAHIVRGSVTATNNLTTVTFTGSAVFTSNTSYTCTTTPATADNSRLIGITYTSGAAVAFTWTGNTAAITFNYICVGN